MKLRKTILVTLVAERMNYLGINLTKDIKICTLKTTKLLCQKLKKT